MAAVSMLVLSAMYKLSQHQSLPVVFQIDNAMQHAGPMLQKRMCVCGGGGDVLYTKG